MDYTEYPFLTFVLFMYSVFFTVWPQLGKVRFCILDDKVYYNFPQCLRKYFIDLTTKCFILLEDRKASEKSTDEQAKGVASAGVARNPSARNRDDFAAYWEAIPQHREDTPWVYKFSSFSLPAEKLMKYIPVVNAVRQFFYAMQMICLCSKTRKQCVLKEYL